MEGQLLPSERARELLQEVIGCEISEATLYNTRRRCYEELAAVEAYIKSGIQVAPVIHFDETGMRVKSKLLWLHVACNGWLTAYFINPKRGQLAMDAIDILPIFEGVSVHDGLASYGKFGYRSLFGVADYGYDFNFPEDRKTYIHRTFDLFKIVFSYLDSATPSLF